MFGIGTTELLIIFFLALILLGPKKIPQIAKSLGKAVNELRRVTDEVKESMRKETDLSEDLKKLKDPTKWLNDEKPEKDSGG